MRSWRESIGRLKAIDSKSATFPLLVFKAASPSDDQWPDSLPSNQSILDFYRVCDGGYLGPHYNIFSITEITQENERWVSTLKDWDESGDILDPQRHLVFALDSGGCPVVLDTQTGEVAIFQFDGGTWEPPLADSFEQFLETLFNPEPDSDSLWFDALAQLDSA